MGVLFTLGSALFVTGAATRLSAGTRPSASPDLEQIINVQYIVGVCAFFTPAAYLAYLQVINADLDVRFRDWTLQFTGAGRGAASDELMDDDSGAATCDNLAGTGQHEALMLQDIAEELNNAVPPVDVDTLFDDATPHSTVPLAAGTVPATDKGRVRYCVVRGYLRRLDYWGTLLQFVGVIIFDYAIAIGWWSDASWEQADLALWLPYTFASVLFTLGGYFQFADATHAYIAWMPDHLAYWVTLLNFLGSAGFLTAGIMGFFTNSQPNFFGTDFWLSLVVLVASALFLLSSYLVIPELLTPAPLFEDDADARITAHGSRVTEPALAVGSGVLADNAELLARRLPHRRRLFASESDMDSLAHRSQQPPGRLYIRSESTLAHVHKAL